MHSQLKKNIKNLSGNGPSGCSETPVAEREDSLCIRTAAGGKVRTRWDCQRPTGTGRCQKHSGEYLSISQGQEFISWP